MSQTDEKETILSETTEEQFDSDNLKLVPVSESIRYRKRAQSAEKKVETLAEELAEAKSRSSEMANELGKLQVEQQLMRKLASAGTIDLEAAVLICKSKLETDAGADLESVVEQVKKEKQYLFAETGVVGTAKKTSGAKDRMQNSPTNIERAAKKAAKTGSRVDLQEYLKLRRNFI